MSAGGIDALIDTLVAEARPVRPLAAPGRRALAWLAAVAVAGALVIVALSDPRLLLARHAGREALLALEQAAVLATGVVAILGAFFRSVPGASRAWLWAPLPPLLLWLALSGAGCLAAPAPAAPGHGDARHCLAFVLAASLALALPLVWRLSRARPVDPLPVALLGGLGVAALSAFLLAFFHPFTVTFLDLGAHLAAILVVVAVMGAAGRRALAAA